MSAWIPACSHRPPAPAPASATAASARRAAPRSVLPLSGVRAPRFRQAGRAPCPAESGRSGTGTTAPPPHRWPPA